MKLSLFFTRNIEYEDLLEKFLTAAIAAVLGIRLFLKLTNYPQLEGRGLHIAHMLWGGLLMLAAIIILLLFLSRWTRQLAAVVGGLGFGTFIDEIGKFITRDNNYFYQPTAAIIYVLFILMYLGTRIFKKYSKFSNDEYLVNSLELIKEAVISELDEEEKKRALRYLDKVRTKNQIYQSVAKLYRRLDTIPVTKPNILVHFSRELKNFYFKIVRQQWFINLLTSFFILSAAVNFFIAVFFIFRTTSFIFSFSLLEELKPLKASDILSLGANALAAFFVILGALSIRRSKLLAYRQFKRSILVSIFLVQVFTFYKDQFSAFFGLVLDILLLTALNYMIKMERAKSA